VKLISLNTWGGAAFDPLMDFIKKQAKTTDIFCFQEIYRNDLGLEQVGSIRGNLLVDLQSILSEYRAFFYPVIKGYDLDGEFAHKIDLDLEFGLAIFVKKSLVVKSNGQRVIYDDQTGVLNSDFSNLPVYFQFLDFDNQGKNFTICNLHGIPEPGNKLDTPARIDQSKKILEFLFTKPNAKILVGDFNLLPDTQSIRMIEQSLKNLIKAYKIQLTRSRLTPYYEKESFQPFADYTFVSDDVEVESFEVPDIEISDHLPMILEFS